MGDSPWFWVQTVRECTVLTVFSRSFVCSFSVVSDCSAVSLSHHRRYLAFLWLMFLLFLHAFAFEVWFWDSGRTFRKKFEAFIYSPLVAISGPLLAKKLITLIDCFKIRANLWGRSTGADALIMCPYMQLFITLILPAHYFLPCEFLSFIKRASDHGMCKILVETTIPLENWSSLSDVYMTDFRFLVWVIRDHNDS
jgi:hypothetical protein